MSEWVHNNFWKYHAITKIPLIIMVVIVWVVAL